jgi:hypothetical protein
MIRHNKDIAYYTRFLLRLCWDHHCCAIDTTSCRRKTLRGLLRERLWMEKRAMKIAILFMLFIATLPNSFSETRSAQDMAKECRVALDFFQSGVEKSFENTLSIGECIGYIQGAADVSLAIADNVRWFKVCVPDSTSTMTLIEKFIAFVGKNPKYTLASTAFQLMLADEFPCKK